MFHLFFGLLATSYGVMHLPYPPTNSNVLGFIGAVAFIVLGILAAVGVFGAW